MNFHFAALALALAVNAAATAEVSWDVLTDAQLPTPISDHSATYIPAAGGASTTTTTTTKTTTTAGIYIAGGCDSPNGNTHVDADGLELDFFLCESISNQLHVFHPDGGDGDNNNDDSGSFKTLAELPRPRYRHAAVHANGKLWLVGGRTIPEDLIIPEVDVYDPSTDSWTTVGTIPEEYWTSDNGAFATADGSTIYVVGGYNSEYYNPDALATTFSFDTKSSLEAAAANNNDNNNLLIQDLVVTKRADLLTGRGDIHAVSSFSSSQDSDGSTTTTAAYVAGGYAGMCMPLTSAEVYDVENDVWSSAGDLLRPRGDGAMVETGGIIYAIGGEVNHPDQCAAPELVPPLAHQSVAVDDVEALVVALLLDDSDSGNDASQASSSSWVDVVDIPEFRFRFSAASWPSTGVAYAFGGQTSFDEDCKCFPTTTEITAIRSINDRDEVEGETEGEAVVGAEAPAPTTPVTSSSDATATAAGQGDSMCEDDDCETDKGSDSGATPTTTTIEQVSNSGDDSSSAAAAVISSAVVTFAVVVAAAAATTTMMASV